MTMEIIIRQSESHYNTGYMVHCYHETDMYDFMKNHPNKENVSIHTRNHEGVEWFTVKLTAKDVRTIKTTSWFHNTSWDYPQLDDEIKEGVSLEVFLVEPIIKE